MNRSTELLALVGMAVCCLVVQVAVAADGSAPIGISQAEMRLRGILQDKADLQVADQPLKDVLAMVKDKYQLDVQIDDATFNQMKADAAAKRDSEKKENPKSAPTTPDYDPLATKISFS